MKKIISLILALVMVMGLAISASAASITITPPTTDGTETGATYAAYKIFDADISGDNVAYTIDSSNPYFATIQAATDYFTLTQVNGTTTYTVTVKDAYDETAANTFADTLKAVEAEPVGTVSGNKITDLTDGYYLVTSSVGSDLILDTIGDITVASKNSYPSLEKKVEGKEATTADMGEVITFTIDVTIPEDAVGEIVVHDKMTGLTYQEMTTAVAGITAATTDLSDDCAVEFTLSADYVAANKGTKVTITYTAKVTADVANNEAWLVDDTFTSTPDSTEVLSTDIVIDKYDSTNKETKLAGAKFVLKNIENKFYAVDDDGVVSWVENQTNATVVTTDANGAAEFENIADGIYDLVEIEAPAGYNLLTSPVKVTVTANKSETTVLDITAAVENSTGSELPSTGGMGTTLFYVIGGLLMAGAAVLLVTKRRVA